MKKLIFLVAVLYSLSVQAQPTWSEDIACIIYTHCSSCHNDVGVAPFNLMNYQDAFNNRYWMQASITDQSMPPWPPDQSYQPIAHSNALTDEEIALFNDWVNAGAPEGDPTLTPDPPVFETNMEIPNPDVSLVTETYTVTETEEDIYKCFVIPTNWAEDRYVSDLEIFPNNKNIVHHVLVYTNMTNDPIDSDNDDPEVGYSCPGSLEGGDNVLFGEWVPGSKARRLPEGTGIKIPSGANLVLQVHYPKGSENQSDYVNLNMNFATGNNVREVIQDQTLDHIDDMVDGPLVIFPNQTRTFHEKFVLPEARTFLATAPHAHLICINMWSFAIKPNGDTINMINIPKWDFDWQGFYDYPEPIVLPAGTELHGYATYQNDSSNPNNPNNPPVMVTLGEATTDEMMIFFYSYLVYESGDENLYTIGEDTGHLEGCEPTSTAIEETVTNDEMFFFPNPIVTGQVFIHGLYGLPSDGYSFVLTDLTGKQLCKRSIVADQSIDLPTSLANGIYLGSIFKNGQKLKSEKIVVLR